MVCIQTLGAQSCWAGVCHSNISHRWVLQGAELGKPQACKTSSNHEPFGILVSMPNTRIISKSSDFLFTPMHLLPPLGIMNAKVSISGSWWLHSSPDLPHHRLASTPWTGFHHTDEDSWHWSPLLLLISTTTQWKTAEPKTPGYQLSAMFPKHENWDNWIFLQ